MANGIACALCPWSPHLSSLQDSGAWDSESNGPRSPASSLPAWAGREPSGRGQAPPPLSRERCSHSGKAVLRHAPLLAQYHVSVGPLVVPVERSASSLGRLRPRGVVSGSQRLPRVTAAVVVGGAGKGGAPVPPSQGAGASWFHCVRPPPQGN